MCSSCKIKGTCKYYKEVQEMEAMLDTFTTDKKPYMFDVCCGAYIPNK